MDFGIQIDEIYRIQKRNDISLYLVKCEELGKSKDNINREIFVVKIDNNSKAFSIYLEDYAKDEGYTELSINQKINIELKSLMLNANNSSNYSIVYTSTYQEDLFRDFKRSWIYNTYRAYYLLDEDCKEKMFNNNYEQFKHYLNENFSKISTMNIKNTEIDRENGYTLYKYTTNTDINVILKVESVMKYKIIINNSSE